MEEEMKGAKVGVDTTETSKRSGQLTIVKYVALMGLAGALLGPWLDNYHDFISYCTVIKEHEILKSALWVPFLFGVAGVIIGALYVWLDTALQDYSRSSTVSPQSLKAATSFNQFLTEGGNKILPPTIDSVLYCISLFSAQYASLPLKKGEKRLGRVGGRGENSQWTENVHFFTFQKVVILGKCVLSHVILAAVAVWGFYKFDNSLAGLLASLATAMGGPAIEIGLVNVLHAYSYSNADLWGVDSWIPWVYFLGGPAVGNLGRLTWHELNK
eukprot:jgi/Bigna1/126406/aug1.2_g1114